MCSKLGGETIVPNANVLRRKLRNEPTGADEQAISPVKAARMGLARASEKAFNLALRVSSIRQSRLDLADAVEKIEEDWALFPLKHDDGSVGVMCFEPACIVAFVERQTLGHVRKEAAPSRRLTLTDKALAISFLEVFLRQFDEALRDAPTAYWTCGYRPEDAVPSRHLMVLQLEASEFRGFDVQCDISGADNPFKMRLLLPIKEKEDARPIRNKSKQGFEIKRPVQAEKSLQKAALSASVEMDAIMCKVMLPLSELGDLKPGQLVPLPQNATQQAFLIDRVGRTEQAIHLGQLHGLRAVRLMLEKTEEGVAPELSNVENPQTAPAQPVSKPQQEMNSEEELQSQKTSESSDELDELMLATTL